MANGYFERGEMYDILFGDGLSGEMAAHRPGIIISSDEGNRTSPTVVMVYTTTTTTTTKNISVNHKFVMNGWENYALCSQIVTINKTRLKKCYGRLSDKDMCAIDDCLDIALDLGFANYEEIKEKETEIAARDIQIKELKEEIAKLKTEIAARDDDNTAVKVEIAMWQRLYEKALDQVCSMKLTGDVVRRVEKKAPVVEEVQKKPAALELPVEDEPKLVDINSCKFIELKKIGLSDNIAMTIVNRRPYKNISDLKNLPGLTSVKYKLIENKICCSAVKKPVVSALPEADLGYEPPEKVNINTAKAAEIKEALGCGINAAYAITRHRKTNGLITSLEELASLPFWTESMLAKHRDKMEV